jgi:hypothetical protein
MLLDCGLARLPLLLLLNREKVGFTQGEEGLAGLSLMPAGYLADFPPHDGSALPLLLFDALAPDVVLDQEVHINTDAHRPAPLPVVQDAVLDAEVINGPFVLAVHAVDGQ